MPNSCLNSLDCIALPTLIPQYGAALFDLNDPHQNLSCCRRLAIDQDYNVSFERITLIALDRFCSGLIAFNPPSDGDIPIEEVFQVGA